MQFDPTGRLLVERFFNMGLLAVSSCADNGVSDFHLFLLCATEGKGEKIKDSRKCKLKQF